MLGVSRSKNNCTGICWERTGLGSVVGIFVVPETRFLETSQLLSTLKRSVDVLV